MKERGIIMSGGNPSAILEGRKTQTRRIAKGAALEWLEPGMFTREYVASPENHLCPYGQPGDRLWVKETWWQPEPYSYGTLPSGEPMSGPRSYSKYAPVLYASDGNPLNTPNQHYPDGLRGGLFSAPDPYAIWKKRPSIFMPRWASRILLEIATVRVERLQDISEADAKAEGIYGAHIENGWYWRNYMLSDEEAECSPMLTSPIESYRSLWESINGAGSWDANPYVWVIEFKRVAP
jgi:hypothetical protein